MKKLFAGILSLLLIVSVMPLTAGAANYSGSISETISWVINSSTGAMNILGSGEMPDYEQYQDVPWFGYVSSVKSISFDANIRRIGNNTFYSMPYLATISLPKNCNYIGKYAFADCNKISKITVPDNVNFIDEYAFYSCDGLKTLILGNKLATIGKNAFSYCRQLPTVTLPASMRVIDDRAFHYCDSLSNISLNEGLTTIGAHAFDTCSALIEIGIPSTVTSIGEDAFFNSNALAEINVASANTTYSSISGVLYNKAKTSLIKFPPLSSIDSYNPPSTLKTVEKNALYHNLILKNIDFTSVETFGNNAVYNCTDLLSVKISDKAVNLGTGLFAASSRVTVKCVRNSAMHLYCQQNNIPYSFDFFINSFPVTYYGVEGKGSALVSVEGAPEANTSVPVGSVANLYLAAGRYKLTITKSGHTKCTVTGFNPQTSVLGASDVIIYAGDINGDGYVNAKDNSILTEVYGVRFGVQGYNSSADFNEDGYINAKDRAILLMNFAKTSKTIAL